MALSTFSIFYYGLTFDSTNNKIDFSEIGGSSGLQAVVNTGSYTFTDTLTQIKTALDAAGTGTYSVTGDRSTRQITIAGPSGGFALLTDTGLGTGSSPWELLGFDETTDQVGLTGYQGASGAGSTYEPQFYLQDYIAKDDFQELVDVNVIESANGTIETVAFGTRNFFQMNIAFATNIAQPDNVVIKNNPSGVESLQLFLKDITQKRPFEFMPDIGDRDSFQKVLLERTAQSQDGTGYRLREQYTRGLPGYYETGNMSLRLVTT